MTQVREGRVIRVEESDGDVTEWRIVEVERRRRTDGAEELRVKCESIARDMFRRTPLIQRVESNRADLDFNLLRLKPDEWIDNVVLNTPGMPSWIMKGTVESTLRVSAFADVDSAGELMDKIAELTAHEWGLTRANSSAYNLDLVFERGESSNRPFVGLKRNLLSARHVSSAKEQATRVYPLGGGPQAQRATMADHKWTVTARSTVNRTVTAADPAGGDGPVGFADQLGGATGFSQNFWLEKPDGTRAQITDSTTGQVLTLSTDTTVPSTGDLVSVRASSSGDELVYLEDPANRTTYGLQVRVLDRRDIPDVQNLLSDVATAHLNDWDTGSTGLPNGWNLVGTTDESVVTKETAVGFWRHGGAAAKVVASSEGVGLESDEIPVSPTSGDPFFTVQAMARADVGTYQVHLVDAANGDSLYPSPSVNAAKNSRLGVLARHDVTPAANFDDLGSTAMKVRIVARGGSATFYLDAAQLLHRASPAEQMHENRAANALWQAANDELDARGAPEDQYEIEPIDLYRTDITKFPDDKLDFGQRFIAKDPGLEFDAELRIVGRKRDLAVPGKVTLSVDHRRMTLAERLRERLDTLGLADEAPPQTGADRTEGNPLSALEANFSPLTSAAQSGRLIKLGLVSDADTQGNISMSSGTLVLSPFSPTQTFTIQSLEAHELGQSTNFDVAANMRFAVFSDDAFEPGTRLYQSANIALDGSGGNVVDTGPIIELEAGQTYWLGYQITTSTGADSPTMSFRTGGYVGALGGSQVQTVTLGGSLQLSGQGTSVPATYPGGGSVQDRVPTFGMEV